MPIYLLEATFNPDSPVNGPAAMLWAHLHRNYAWRKRVFPSYATLARETDQSESAVKRQMAALKQVGAIEWGANYGPKGRSSNEYALAPVKPFAFDRNIGSSVEVKNDLHQPVEVKNEPGVEVISDTNPQVKNDLGVESTEELEISLSSPLSTDPAGPPATDTDEREIPADAQKIANAWADAKGLRAPRTEKTIAADAQTLLDAGADLDHLCRVAVWMAAVGYSDLERAMTHKGAPKPIHQQRASPGLETCDRCRDQGRPGWIDYTDETTGRDKTTRCTHASEQAA
jgi:hypothetical protein